jgi:hypothetical protein
MSLSPFDTGSNHRAVNDSHTAPLVIPSRRRRAARDVGALPTSTDGWSTCPVCLRTWQVTAADDVLLPVCGCHGEDWTEANRWRPCTPCGHKHEQDCQGCVDTETDDDWLPEHWEPGAPHTFGKGLDS